MADGLNARILRKGNKGLTFRVKSREIIQFIRSERLCEFVVFGGNYMIVVSGGAALAQTDITTSSEESTKGIEIHGYEIRIIMRG